MTKITSEQSRAIYELATSPDKKTSNTEIAKKLGITETAVRYHIKKWEKELHAIAKTNAKIASALANHTINVYDETTSILTEVKTSIQEAKSSGVSPEKLAPLYSNWIKSLELASELLGEIDRSPSVNVQINQQFNEFMRLVLEEVNPADKARIISRLRQAAIY